jgi:hypothetical protein
MNGMTRECSQPERFPGFRSEYGKDYFKYPMILESYWVQLSGAEQKILDFILRQTLGYQKTSDFISLSQFVNGNTDRNKGAGVSRAQVVRCLDSLEEKGYITLNRRKFRTTEISLAIESNTESSDVPVMEMSGEAVRLIEMFRVISPHQTDRFKKDRRHVRAIEVLLQSYGAEQVEQAILLANEVNGKKYGPTITSPIDLEKKWSNLVAYIRKYGDEQKNGFKMIF